MKGCYIKLLFKMTDVEGLQRMCSLQMDKAAIHLGSFDNNTRTDIRIDTSRYRDIVVGRCCVQLVTSCLLLRSHSNLVHARLRHAENRSGQ